MVVPLHHKRDLIGTVSVQPIYYPIKLLSISDHLTPAVHAITARLQPVFDDLACGLQESMDLLSGSALEPPGEKGGDITSPTSVTCLT
ncbi:hypothetical protein [Pantoea alhagi]|uniref:hypothetical protein n=1 Tax=Pantoea alhagi TaxID=1891675 RepID=UPI0012F48E61|nr:hypothetical protein [Pantoea alhagi]